MADGRMKAVVEGEGEEEEEGFTELELGLSLGFTGWHVGHSSPDTWRWSREVLASADVGEVEKEIERDLQHKRARIFDFGESSQYAAASLFGSDPSSSEHNGDSPEIPPPVLSETDSGDLRPMDFEYGAGDGNGENPSSGNGEDSEMIRMDLSDDLLHLIFSFLGQKDLCRAGATCKQWQAASSHEEFWRSLKFKNIAISQENFVSICRRYQNVTELNMLGVPNADVLVLEAIDSLRRLEHLTLGKGQIWDGLLQALIDCPALTTLSISDASLGNGAQEITLQHDRLRDLQIVKCRALRISIRCPQVERVSLRRTSMGYVTLQCPAVRELDLGSCHKLSDTSIRGAVVSCPLLSSLDLSSCSSLSDESLREISLACPSLSLLDLSYCPNISFESVRLPMLVDLKLHSCEGITSASMAAISLSRLLQVLQLDNCSLLTSVSLDLPHLRNISLVHLRKFVDLNLRSPVLSYIKVSRCSALHRISISSNSLQKLVLQKQESLTTLSLQCPNLVDVDLSDCESLTNSICEVFSDGGGCPMLRSLVLDNCESLSLVELRSCSLLSLSLAGCRTMTHLQLSCPNLQKVNLDGCDHLERATFSPVGLETLNLGICPKLSIVHIEAPKMTALELKGCGVLSKASIHCPCLKALDASFCRQFVDESLSMTAVSCPLIEFLNLSSCLAIGADGLCSLNSLGRLTLLDLSYTFLFNLQPVFDSCSQLKVLKLSACKYLTDSSLDALYREGALPSLLELDLSYSSIGQTAITELLSSCTNLVHMNLNGCNNLHELIWGTSDEPASVMMSLDDVSDDAGADVGDLARWRRGRLLEVLNCTGCPNVRRVVIPSALCCLHLSKINLNLSTNLKEVDLTCSNLSTLNLSHCSSLEILKLDCPRLTNLQLLSCSMLVEEELESAIGRCTMLESLNIHCCNKINLDDFGKLRMLCPSLKRIQSTTLVI